MSESIVNKSPSCYQQERLNISGLQTTFSAKKVYHRPPFISIPKNE